MFFAEFVEAELDFLEVSGFAGFEGAVPEGEEGGIIGIGFGAEFGMVDAMDVGGDDEFVEDGFGARGEADVGVVKLDDGEEDCFVDDEFAEADSENEDQRNADERGEDDFAEVKACGGSDVEIRFGMVDAMEAPEEGDGVIEAVPGVHPAVKDQQRGDEVKPFGRIDPIEEADAAVLSEVGGPEPGLDENDSDGDGIDEAEDDVAEAVFDAEARAFSEPCVHWRKGFPDEEKDEQSEGETHAEALAEGDFVAGALHDGNVGDVFFFEERGVGGAEGMDEVSGFVGGGFFEGQAGVGPGEDGAFEIEDIGEAGGDESVDQRRGTVAEGAIKNRGTFRVHDFADVFDAGVGFNALGARDATDGVFFRGTDVVDLRLGTRFVREHGLEF